MPTPIENLTQNVNASSQRTVLQAVADDATARQQVADKPSAINAIVDNADQQAVQNFFGGIAGDETSEDLLTGDNALIDKVSEDVDAIETLDASESAIRKILCRREGRDPANFADLDAVAADVSLVQDFSVREVATDIITNSDKAHDAIAANDRATREMMCHPAGLDATTFTDVSDVASDNVAMTTIAADAQASRAMAAVPLAMQEVAASQPAMQEVAASQTAMQEVAASQTAMQEVAASQTAMQEIAASQTAIDSIASNDNDSIAENTVLNSGTATTEFINSPLVADLSVDFSNGQSAAQTITNSRVLVVSNSNNVNGNATINIDYVNDVGPETQSGSTFIINSASIGNDPNNNGGGNADLSGIIIN